MSLDNRMKELQASIVADRLMLMYHGRHMQAGVDIGHDMILGNRAHCGLGLAQCVGLGASVDDVRLAQRTPGIWIDCRREEVSHEN